MSYTLVNILEKIKTHLELLSKFERRIAEVILLSLQTVIDSPSLAILTRTVAEAREPTVNRFSYRLKSKGHPDFKFHLAQSLANRTSYVNRNVDEDDSVGSYIQKSSSTRC